MSKLNLLHDDIADIAEAIKLKMITRGRNNAWMVYARRDGMVAMDCPADYQRKTPLPDADLVGVYTRSAKVREILEDLAQRRAEINVGRAA